MVDGAQDGALKSVPNVNVLVAGRDEVVGGVRTHGAVEHASRHVRVRSVVACADVNVGERARHGVALEIA